MSYRTRNKTPSLKLLLRCLFSEFRINRVALYEPPKLYEVLLDPTVVNLNDLGRVVQDKNV